MHYIKIAVAAALAAAITGTPNAGADPSGDNDASQEFDWAQPYGQALSNHALADQYWITSKGISVMLAMQEGCQLVPAIGAVATVDYLADDYRISHGQAGLLLVAAADVCPKIRPMLG